MTFAIPVSSSSERKTKPFAVPGRWRTITLPATRTRPSSRRRLAPRARPARAQRGASERHRVAGRA